MKNTTCPSCGWFYTLSEAEMHLIFNPPLPYIEILHTSKRILREKQQKNNQNPQQTDIETNTA
jgi:hypothetical protein